ncbi:winged helix-turn-helix transcriptional regulator [Aureimonas sp. Leaf324]|jgi:DNA-binding HxlR family transcriptional regulator|uniref:winged helix-turn-helix transcriptional regulator n=1 Tax=Aureimonas sp. Leaf324 TaxID=1736336 RepID=UPI0006F6B703|nr:winged helix-turn-helix transcriptional regulator [Aureimonas sp. Leaf324]KQQ85970.1 transcriptional regulator [Aureimonas sp. Leaf324]
MKSEKITNGADPTSTERRWPYRDACAAAHALELLGERWTLLVMRELMPGPRRFSDLRAGLPGISANVLTQRLDWLEEAGVIVRRELAPPSGARVYELTEWGREAEPIFRVVGRWGSRSPFHDPTASFSTASLMLSLRTMFEPERADGFAGRIGFRLGREALLAVVAEGGIEVAAGSVEGADAVLIGEPRAVAATIYGGQSLETLEAAGVLAVEGDRETARRFTTFFPLPEKAPLPAG